MRRTGFQRPGWGSPAGGRLGVGCASLALAGCLAIASARAEAPPKDDPAPASASGPRASGVDLDSLLKLPDSLDYAVERRGKATEPEWRSRFQQARGELETARKALADSQQALERVAGGSDAWQLAPPGINLEGTGNVDAHRLRQAIKRQRAEVERAERQIRELEIEANLASVPEGWRE